MNKVIEAKDKLAELANRIEQMTANSEARSLWIHWSDAPMLRQVIEVLSSIENQTNALNRAVLSSTDKESNDG